MARTKQTARKATGEPAPRKELVVPAKRKAASEDDESQAGKRRSTRKSKKVAVEPEVEAGTAAGPVQGAVEDDRHNKYCAGCRNGGTVVDCSTCKRVVCNNCIKFPSVINEKERFLCPVCHLIRPGEKEWVIAPYKGFIDSKEPTPLISVPTTREAFALCSTPALVVISIRLASVDRISDSARVVFHNIAGYLPNRIAFVDLPYDLGNDEAFEAYNKKIDALVERLEKGDLKGFRNFAVYLTDHSDPERGDLHFTVGGQGAAKVASVLEQLFPPPLTAFFNEGQRNILTMLVCGALMSVDAAYRDMKAFADRGHFNWVMAFGQKTMQPCLANQLLQNASVSWFINERRWDAILDEVQNVGAHTDIYLLQKDKPTVRYIWSHQSVKPFGTPAPYSCPKCHAYKPWGAPKRIKAGANSWPAEVVHKCRNPKCGHEVAYELNKAFIKHTKGDVPAVVARGEWYRELKA
ncbi:hypothetical protein LshimejAT787_0702190 [Lyophyllum shimeji]|uniref:Uncharacterized protein n=1 Tax=Lyophyllum shimeji TaxID=47721 RepID=A0A9P3PQG4_LYOSH|nr:hypothetical protein LshimejAT787_0702190 [Lyophyllum shimeji]